MERGKKGKRKASRSFPFDSFFSHSFDSPSADAACTTLVVSPSKFWRIIFNPFISFLISNFMNKWFFNYAFSRFQLLLNQNHAICGKVFFAAVEIFANEMAAGCEIFPVGCQSVVGINWNASDWWSWGFFQMNVRETRKALIKISSLRNAFSFYQVLS